MFILKELWEDEHGAVATEYIVLLGLIAIALIVTIIAFRDAIVTKLTEWKEQILNLK
jgi:Flp pilus assembly pilin Flp